jgi:phage FluMu protein Com
MATLREYRCSNCKTLFFKGLLVEVEIEVRCKRCHTMNTVQVSRFDDYLCLVYPCPHRIKLAERPEAPEDIPKADA